MKKKNPVVIAGYFSRSPTDLVSLLQSQSERRIYIYQEHATALHSAVVLPISRVSKQCTDFIGGAPLNSDQCGCRWDQVF
jgi:hypothetical protein